MTYLANLVVVISLYTMLALSLNLVVGYGGLMSLCHAAFYGIGAYTSTLLIIEAGWPFTAATLAACILAALVGAGLGISSVRLRGDYFVLATLGFQVIAFSLFNNWSAVTKGSFGIGGIPPPSVVGLVIDTTPQYALFSLLVMLIVAAVLRLLVTSPYGRLLRAVREDEDAATACGKNVRQTKIVALAISAAIAAIPGALFAAYVGYIDPTSFTVAESIVVLSIVAVGGAGSFGGPVVGAVLLVMLPEALRFLALPDAAAAALRQIIYGTLLVILMRVRPAGLLGTYRFG